MRNWWPLVRFVCVLGMVVAMPLLRLKRWKVVLGANSAHPRELNAYIPLALKPFFEGRFYPMGFIRAPQGLSLVVGAPHDNRQLLEDPRLTRTLLADITRWRASRIALNGVIPSAASKHGAWPDDSRLVREQFGTVYMILGNIRELIRRYGLKKPAIAVVGCGYTGSRLVNRLQSLGYPVRAYDENPARRELLDDPACFRGNEYAGLAEVAIVVLLTTSGDEGITPLIPHLARQAAVISDTHPKVSRKLWRQLQARGVSGYESALTLPGAFFWPPMPRWDGTTIPGCVAQALTEAIAGRPAESLEDFEALADEVGLVARLDRPLPAAEPSPARLSPAET